MKLASKTLLIIGGTIGLAGLAKVLLLAKHHVREWQKLNRASDRARQIIEEFEQELDEDLDVVQRTPTELEPQYPNGTRRLQCGLLVTFTPVEPSEEGDEGPTLYEQGKQNQRPSKNRVIMELASACRNRFMNMEDNKANRIVARDWLYREMISRGMRTKHISQSLPVATELAFIPSDAELVAKDYRASQIAVHRKAYVKRAVWGFRWREQDLFPSFSRVDPGDAPA